MYYLINDIAPLGTPYDVWSPVWFANPPQQTWTYPFIGRDMCQRRCVSLLAAPNHEIVENIICSKDILRKNMKRCVWALGQKGRELEGQPCCLEMQSILN